MTNLRRNFCRNFRTNLEELRKKFQNELLEEFQKGLPDRQKKLLD